MIVEKLDARYQKFESVQKGIWDRYGDIAGVHNGRKEVILGKDVDM